MRRAANIGRARGKRSAPHAFADRLELRRLLSGGLAAVPPPIDESGGFTSTVGLTLNGSAKLTGPAAAAPEALQLTPNLPGLSGSAFATPAQNVSSFQTHFDFEFPQPGGPNSDGFTFVIQNDPAGPRALAGGGGALGYAGIHNSVAVKFDLYDNSGEGSDSTGLFVDGDYPTVPQGGNSADVSVDMGPSGIFLHAPGDRFEVSLRYDGGNLRETVTDLTAGTTFAHSYAVNIPQLVGGVTAYVGFTGGTGAGTAEQDVLNWVYVPTPATVSGTSGGDTIVLKRDANGSDIDWLLNGRVAAAVPADTPAGLTIDGAGGADTIILDPSNGNPLPDRLNVNGEFTLRGFTGLSVGQTIDLVSGTLAVAYQGESPAAFLRGYLRSGFDGGRWDGTGIVSSSIGPGMAITDIDAGSAVVLGLRLTGDANGDGTVDFNDLLVLAQNFGRRTGIDWSAGDFTYDGAVDFSDLLLLAQNYGHALPAAAASVDSANLLLKKHL